MQQALDRVEAAGGKPPTVARIFDVVLAPIYLRAVFGYESPDKDLDVLVDQAPPNPARLSTSLPGSHLWRMSRQASFRELSRLSSGWIHDPTCYAMPITKAADKRLALPPGNWGIRQGSAITP